MSVKLTNIMKLIKCIHVLDKFLVMWYIFPCSWITYMIHVVSLNHAFQPSGKKCFFFMKATTGNKMYVSKIDLA